MATAKDIKLTDSLDLDIVNGDFKISESDQTHIILLMKTYQGSWKQFPLVGLGIDYYIASSGSRNLLKRAMTVQMEADDYKVNEIIVTGESTYYIDAERNDF